jgi:hypothetical protein
MASACFLARRKKLYKAVARKNIFLSGEVFISNMQILN